MSEEVVILNEEETKEEQPITEESLKEEGLSEDEIALAKKNGLIKEPEEKSEKEEQEPEKKEDEKEENQGDELNLDSLDSFDKVHEIYEKTPDKFRTLPKYVKALYHNSKGLYKRAKIEEQKRQDLEKKMEFESVRNKGAEIKLEKIKEALGKEDLTVEDLQAVLGEKVEVEKKEEPKKDDVDSKQVEFLRERYVEAEKLGNAEHENFNDIINMASEVTEKKPRYKLVLQQTFMDETATEKDIVDLIVDIAKLNDRFGKDSEQSEKKEVKNETVDRMIKNSAKKPSSAAIGGGKGGTTKSFDELTPEDVLRMSNKEYAKLPKEVRERLLLEI